VTEQQAELYSLLVPLTGERLLVPRACVAEVIAFVVPEQVETDDPLPGWFLGFITWNGRRLPVASFEAISGTEASKRPGRTRIVVFNTIGDVLQGGYYGIITQGFPQLVRVNADVLTPADEQTWAEGQPVLCRARMINEYPLIPDMERLESMIAEACSAERTA
jgi:chemosensory pili system protein ChpC